MYQYQTERPRLFTEEGMNMMLDVRAKVHDALRKSGAFKSSHVTVAGDSWLNLAVLDYFAERGEIIEVTGSDAAGQDRVFVGGRNHGN